MTNGIDSSALMMEIQTLIRDEKKPIDQDVALRLIMAMQVHLNTSLLHLSNIVAGHTDQFKVVSVWQQQQEHNCTERHKHEGEKNITWLSVWNGIIKPIVLAVIISYVTAMVVKGS